MLRKKICLLGDFSVGKTSLIRRFVDDRFDDQYLSTIGAKVSRTTLAFASGSTQTSLDLLIWDMAGGERFDAMMRSYYGGAAGAILVCDLTRPETVEGLSSYARQFWLVNPHTPLLVLGNKSDLAEPGMLTATELSALASNIGAPSLLVSAKTGANVGAAFYLIAERLLAAPALQFSVAKEA